MKVKSLSRVRLSATPWTGAHQAPLSTGLSRLEYWSGLPFPSPGDFSNLEIEPRSPALRADSLPSEPPGKRSCGSVSLKTKDVKILSRFQKLLPQNWVRLLVGVKAKDATKPRWGDGSVYYYLLQVRRTLRIFLEAA